MTLAEAVILLLTITFGTTGTALGYLYLKGNEDIEWMDEEEKNETK